MKREVKILSGVSGSGKSSYIQEYWSEQEEMSGTSIEVSVSADDYFINKGKYEFHVDELGKAHGYCFRKYAEYLRCLDYNVIWVDNTNTTAIEIAPYVLGAQAYEYDVEIITFMCETQEDIQICAMRNSHKVSIEMIDLMHRNLLERKMMSWWKSSEYPIRK